MNTLVRHAALLAASFFCFSPPAQANTTNYAGFGTVTNGSIPMPGWTNFYVFAAASNDVIFPAVLNTSGSALPYLTLYDSTGAVITTHYDTRDFAILRNYPLSKADTYSLAVSDDGADEAFEYIMSLNVAKGGEANKREPGDGSEAMMPGQITSGHLGLCDYDTYTFTAASNDVAFIALYSPGGARLPYLYLYDSTGAVVAAHYDDSSQAALRNVTLPKSDTYTVAVTEDGFNYEWDYILSINLAKGGGANKREPGDGLETMVPGEITGGHISYADYDTYTFAAASNDVAFIALYSPGGARLPYLHLYDSTGAVVAAHYDDSSQAALRNVTLPKSDTYTVAVTEDGFNYEWDYILSVNLAKGGGANQREPGDGPEAMVPGQITHGHISYADYDTYTFTAASNDVIFLTLFSPSGARLPYLHIYDSTGAVVTAQYDAANYAVIKNFPLPKTDTYTVAVTEDGFNYEWDYILSINLAKGGGANQREPGDGPEVLTPGLVTSGHISLADYDTYTFAAASNDVIFLTVSSTGGARLPYLHLYDSTGAVVTAQWNNYKYATLSNLRLTKDDTYTLAVTEDLFNYEFDYHVCMIKHPGTNAADPGDGPAVLAPSTTASAQITHGDLDAFAFQAIAGDTIALRLRRAPGSGMNPMLQLLAPDGTLVPAGSPADSARGSVLCLPQTGAYLAVVSDDEFDEVFGYQLSFSQTPGPPPANAPPEFLQVMTCSNMVLVRWSNGTTGFRLQSTEHLMSPASAIVWSNIPPPYAEVGGFYFVTNSAPPNERFFRLIKP